MVFWVISVPLVESQAQTRNLLETKLKWQKLADVSNINLPTLKIGTLDSLLSLSDDLVKINGASPPPLLARGDADPAIWGSGGRNSRNRGGHGRYCAHLHHERGRIAPYGERAGP